MRWKLKSESLNCFNMLESVKKKAKRARRKLEGNVAMRKEPKRTEYIWGKKVTDTSDYQKSYRYESSFMNSLGMLPLSCIGKWGGTKCWLSGPLAPKERKPCGPDCTSISASAKLMKIFLDRSYSHMHEEINKSVRHKCRYCWLLVVTACYGIIL